MQNHRLALQKVRIPGREGVCDVIVEGGAIARVAAGAADGRADAVHCGGRLLLPAFVDCHTHLDKAFLDVPGEAAGLMDAVRLTAAYQKSVPKERVREDVLRRGAKVLELEIAHGTGLVRSHVTVDEIWGMEAFFGSCELKRAYRGRVDVQLSVPFHPAFAAEWDKAARAGEIDYIAGYPSISRDYRAAVDALFTLAEQYALPLDLHVDESDRADISCFCYVLEKTIETGLQGRVNCSHVTALSAVPDADAERAIELCQKARVSVIALPSCNMYLMGRGDRGLVRRGVTRVDELEQAGVNVAAASDNIRDPFRPFGNADLLEEALFACQVLSRGTQKGMSSVLNMVTINAAAASGKKIYSITEGAPADLVLVDAEGEKQAIIGISDRLLVLKSGKIVSGAWS